MIKIDVNSGRDDVTFGIQSVENKYNAKFVGQFCLKTVHGDWQSDSCADVYFQANPKEGCSNYFALFLKNNSPYITDGKNAVSGIINAVVANDGEIIYSRFRHDYRTSKDKSAYIDGGRDYVKTDLGSVSIMLKIIDGEFYQLEEGDVLPETEDGK